MADWGLAGLILEHSDRTVALVRRVLDTEKVRVFAGRGVADAIRESSKASAHADEVLKAAEQIVAALGKKPPGTMITESELCRDVLSGKLRIYCAEALACWWPRRTAALRRPGRTARRTCVTGCRKTPTPQPPRRRRESSRARIYTVPQISISISVYGEIVEHLF